MKIAIITSSFPRYLGDFQGNFIYSLSRRLRDLNNNLYVVCPHIPRTSFHETIAGIEIQRFPYFYPFSFQRLSSDTGMDSALHHSILAWFQLPLYFLSLGNGAYRVIRQQDIDIIHTHWLVPQGLVGAFLQWYSGIPHVATVHGSDMNILKKHAILHPVCRFITRHSSIITVNSRYMKQQLLAVSPESERKIRVIPMGIDPMRFSVVSFPDMKERYGAAHIVMSAGRLIDWKGTVFLIRAMPAVLEKIPDTKLLIIGTGPEQDELMRQVHDLGIHDRVEFLGFVPTADLSAYYNSADVFVLPSINKSGKTEGLGVVLLEAMASGCPVIGSDVGGIPDIITDGENGFLVPEQDPVALADRIVRILSEPGTIEKFRKNGYIRIGEYFTWEKIGDRFLSVYSQAIRNSIQSGDFS